jgi:hypothetical protein
MEDGMNVSLASVTPIPDNASEEIKLWIMELAQEVASELDTTDSDIVTQVKVGAERDLGELQLKLNLTITAQKRGQGDDGESPKRRRG